VLVQTCVVYLTIMCFRLLREQMPYLVYNLFAKQTVFAPSLQLHLQRPCSIVFIRLLAALDCKPHETVLKY